MIVENPKFRDMIGALSTDAAEWLLKSRVFKEFDKQRNLLIQKLSTARSRIHLSFDL